VDHRIVIIVLNFLWRNAMRGADFRAVTSREKNGFAGSSNLGSVENYIFLQNLVFRESRSTLLNGVDVIETKAISKHLPEGSEVESIAEASWGNGGHLAAGFKEE